jgi:hypothetical protein
VVQSHAELRKRNGAIRATLSRAFVITLESGAAEAWFQGNPVHARRGKKA